MVIIEFLNKKHSPFPKRIIYMLTPNFILVSDFIQVPRYAYVFCCLEKYFQNNKDNNKKILIKIYFFLILLADLDA